MIKPILKIISFGYSYKFNKNQRNLNKGGRCHRRFRFLFNKKPVVNIPFIVTYLGYDSFRSGYICLNVYINGIFSYELAPIGIRLHQILLHGDPKNLFVGSRHLLLNIPIGTIVYNIEIRSGFGGQIAKSAGSFALLLAKDLDYNFCILKFRSGIKYKVSLDCFATIGRVSNLDFQNNVRKLAGYSRRMGIRPHVRGVAKNPVDHPNGGRTAGGKLFTNKTGRIIKNKKTKNLFKVATNKYIYSIY